MSITRAMLPVRPTTTASGSSNGAPITEMSAPQRRRFFQNLVAAEVTRLKLREIRASSRPPSAVLLRRTGRLLLFQRAVAPQDDTQSRYEPSWTKSHFATMEG